MEIAAAGSEEHDSAAGANSGLAWALQLLGRDFFRSLICWETASRPCHLLLSAGSSQAALPYSPLIVCVSSDKMSRRRRGTRG